MRSSGGTADAGRGRSGRRLERALGAGRRRGRRGPLAGRPGPGTRSASTWAAPPATSAWSTAGEVRRTDSREIEGRPIQLPMVDVHTVGAGGGSIGWARPGRRAAGRAALGRGRAGTGLLWPGRHRARRSPTPTCCSATWPRTPTSPAASRWTAARATGRSPPSAPSSASTRLETAEGIVRVANQEMIRALRVVTVERGVDPRGYALLPFGGAGPMHAAALAAELEITRWSARGRAACSRRSG